MNLNEVLGDKPVPAPVVEAAAETAATDVTEPAKVETEAAPSAAKPEPEKAEAARDDKGRFAKPEPTAPIAALLDERRRRQELEAEVAQYRANKPKTDFFEDPAKATNEHVSEALNPLQREVMDLRVQLQRLQHPDFDDAMRIVLEKVQTDPLLKHQVDSAPDPLEFIYREGKRMKELADVDGDISKYREKVTAAERARISELETRLQAIEAENKALKESITKRSQVPQSLNSEPSAATTSGQFAGPTPLKSILS